MSLHPRPIGPVPEETARVAHAAFPGGNPYMALRDELGTIFPTTTSPPSTRAAAAPPSPPGGWPW